MNKAQLDYINEEWDNNMWRDEVGELVYELDRDGMIAFANKIIELGDV